MKQIDIRELPNLADADLGEGETYTVLRNGEVLGYFVPKHELDPEQRRRENEAFRRKLVEYRANGWLDEQILDNLDRAFAEPSLNGASRPRQVPGFKLEVRHVDICELPRWSDDEIRATGNYALERDGKVVGSFISRLKKDPKAMQEAWAAFDRTIESMLGNGYTREQLEADFDLSKPFQLDR